MHANKPEPQTEPANIISLADRLNALDADPLPATVTAAPATTIPHIVTRRMTDIEPKTMEWLWPGWLPKGMLTLLGGFAGDGKSTLITAIVAALSTGGTLPDGTPAPVVQTAMFMPEDDAGYVVSNRLQVHNADQNGVFVMDGVHAGSGDVRGLNVRTDVPALRQMVEQHNIGLIVLDPVSSAFPNGDRNNEGEVRDALAPLIRLAEETGVAILGVMHVGKSDSYQRSVQRLMGSTAFPAVARCVWMLHPLPEDKQEEGEPTRTVLGVTKSNYAVPPPPLMFSRPHDGALQFHGTSPITLDDAMSWKKPREQATGSDARDDAKSFLYAYLAGGMKRPAEVERAADAKGISKRILRRAKDDMNIQSRRVKDLWYWMLPTE